MILEDADVGIPDAEAVVVKVIVIMVGQIIAAAAVIIIAVQDLGLAFRAMTADGSTAGTIGL
jgi:hypothetical protein